MVGAGSRLIECFEFPVLSKSTHAVIAVSSAFRLHSPNSKVTLINQPEQIVGKQF
jgi:hypothetical protein